MGNADSAVEIETSGRRRHVTLNSRQRASTPRRLEVGPDTGDEPAASEVRRRPPPRLRLPPVPACESAGGTEEAEAVTPSEYSFRSPKEVFREQIRALHRDAARRRQLDFHVYAPTGEFGEAEGYLASFSRPRDDVAFCVGDMGGPSFVSQAEGMRWRREYEAQRRLASAALVDGEQPDLAPRRSRASSARLHRALWMVQ